jgi:hypothetical protein
LSIFIIFLVESRVENMPRGVYQCWEGIKNGTKTLFDFLGNYLIS